jgi:ribosome maturation factor RimP
MRLDLDQIEREITPLLRVHGVELVALDWLQGPGHGILRAFIDRPGGDPREQDPDKSVTLEQVTNVTRDISTALDALDLIEASYTLEIGSPGPQRPVQKRADFERFAGLVARLEIRGPSREKSHLSGTLRGCVDLPDGSYAVKLEVGPTTHEIPHERITRCRLHEITPPRAQGNSRGAGAATGMSRRQQRLAERERARAINAAHRAGLAGSSSGQQTQSQDNTVAHEVSGGGNSEVERAHEQRNHPAPGERAAKR